MMDEFAEATSSTALAHFGRESVYSPLRHHQVDSPEKAPPSPVPAAATAESGTPPSPRGSERSSSSSALMYGRKFPLGGSLKSSLAVPNRSGHLGEAESTTGNPFLVAIRREVGESEKRLTERLIRVERRIEQFRESFYATFNEKLNEAKQWHPEYDRRLAQMEGGVEGVNEELSSLDRKMRLLEPRLAELAQRQVEEVLPVKLEELQRHFQERAMLHTDRVMRLQTAFEELTGYTGRLATLEAQLEAHSEAHEQLRKLTHKNGVPLLGVAVAATNGQSPRGQESLSMGPSPLTEPRSLGPGSLDHLEEATQELPRAPTKLAADTDRGANLSAPVSELLRCERMAAEASEAAEKAIRESDRLASHVRQAQVQAEEHKARVLNLNERLTAQESQMRSLLASSATGDINGTPGSTNSENLSENGYQRNEMLQGSMSLRSAPDRGLRAEVDEIAYKLDRHRAAIEEMKQVMDEKIWAKVKDLERTLTTSGVHVLRKPMHGAHLSRPTWSTSQCFLLCKESEVPKYLDHAKELVDHDGKSPTLEEAVRMLNDGEFPCEEGYCIIHCDLDKAYYVLHKPEMKEEALKLLEVAEDLEHVNDVQNSPSPQQAPDLSRGKLNSKAATGSLCGGCLPVRTRGRS